MKQASEGKIPLERETVAGLLQRWLKHIEARGRASKTLLENRRMAVAITEELGSKELRKLSGRDLDGFYDALGHRGLSATSVRPALPRGRVGLAQPGGQVGAVGARARCAGHATFVGAA